MIPDIIFYITERFVDNFSLASTLRLLCVGLNNILSPTFNRIIEALKGCPVRKISVIAKELLGVEVRLTRGRFMTSSNGFNIEKLIMKGMVIENWFTLQGGEIIPLKLSLFLLPIFNILFMYSKKRTLPLFPLIRIQIAKFAGYLNDTSLDLLRGIHECGIFIDIGELLDILPPTTSSVTHQWWVSPLASILANIILSGISLEDPILFLFASNLEGAFHIFSNNHVLVTKCNFTVDGVRLICMGSYDRETSYSPFCLCGMKVCLSECQPLVI